MGYHPGLFAVYVRAAKRHMVNSNKERLQNQIMFARTIRASTQFNHEGFAEYTEALEKEVDTNLTRKKKISPNDIRNNWLKFGKALGAL